MLTNIPNAADVFWRRGRRGLTAVATHRWLPVWLALLAALLVLPAVWTGFQLDDHFHRMRLLGYGEPAIQLFVFNDGDPAKTLQGMEQGWMPWWTAPTFRHASLRYLAVLTMQLDYLLWPNRPELMHLHSLLWLGGLVAAATLLYRRLLGRTWIAGLAALLYAVDDAHAAPVAYLANRNAVISTCFGVLCLLAHARWREERWRPGAVLAPLCLALALAAGEIALATAGYLLAYWLFLDPRGPRSSRTVTGLSSLLPNGIALAAWAVVYKAGHFGTEGSGFYLDPVGDPRAFAAALIERAPLLLLGQWTPVPSDLGSFFPAGSAGAQWLRLGALAAVAVVAILIAPLVRRDPAARFCCAGSILSLVPIAAVGPQDRLLFFVGLGSMGLLAQAVAMAWGAIAIPQRPGWRRLRRSMVVLLLLVHLGAAPVLAWRASGDRGPGERMIAAIASVPSDAAIAGQDLILVNPPEHVYLVTAIPVVKAMQGAPFPAHLRVLANGATETRLTRVDARTLRVELADGLFPNPFSRYYRGPELPFSAGQRLELTGLEIEVVALNAGGDPIELLYRFAAPLEDPSLRWLYWKGSTYAPWQPPAVGDSMLLPPASGIFG